MAYNEKCNCFTNGASHEQEPSLNSEQTFVQSALTNVDNLTKLNTAFANENTLMLPEMAPSLLFEDNLPGTYDSTSFNPAIQAPQQLAMQHYNSFFYNNTGLSAPLGSFSALEEPCQISFDTLIGTSNWPQEIVDSGDINQWPTKDA